MGPTTRYTLGRKPPVNKDLILDMRMNKSAPCTNTTYHIAKVNTENSRLWMVFHDTLRIQYFSAHFRDTKQKSLGIQ